MSSKEKLAQFAVNVDTCEVGLGTREVSLRRVYNNGVVGLMNKEAIDAAIRRACEKAAVEVLSCCGFVPEPGDIRCIERHVRKELGI